jgi:hypothetical protein
MQNGQEKQSSTHDHPSLIKIDRSDQNTAVVLELACKYLVGQYPRFLDGIAQKPAPDRLGGEA